MRNLDGTGIGDRLSASRERYIADRPRSAALAAAAGEVLPGGHTRTVLHFDPFPFRVAQATGAELIDVDGHRLIDLLGNYTAGLGGHSPAPVAEAIKAAVDQGWSLGATHPDEIEFARRMVERFPALERVRFTNSGTEANLMALMTARHLTGRSRVIVMTGGYHGGVLTFGPTGRAINVPIPVEYAEFNDLSSVETIIAEHGSDIAAIIVEPMLGSAGCIPATPEFLEGIRRLSTDNGSLLIFDEVMTSRLDPSGAQARYGVLPDLCTFGKYLAGGMSFGAFGGRADLLSVFDTSVTPEQGREPLGHAGTFNNNVFTMAAGIAMLDHVVTPDAITALNARGDWLRTELNRVFAEHAVPMTVTGMGSLMNVHAVAQPGMTVTALTDLRGGDERWRELFFFDMMAAGFYLARRGFIALSLPLGEVELEAFVGATARWCASFSLAT